MRTWLFSHRWILVILTVALVVRIFWITNPPADWHAFRQSDTASVTREYVKNGIDLLRPRYQDLSNIQSGLPNIAGWRMVEFPFINALAAFIIQQTGWNEVVVGRSVSIAFSLIGIGSLYVLIKQVSGEKLALVSAVIMTVLPYSVYYSRAILPEAPMIGLFLLALATYDRWLITRKWVWYVSAGIALALALLLKPFIVFVGPVFVALSWYRRGWRGLLDVHAWILGGMAALPFIWWRRWIEQFPSGIPANDWLWNSNGIRWRPAWFRWLFWERLTLLMSGVVGAILSALNMTHLRGKDVIIYAAWWFGMVAYLSAVATGNVQHDYYQVLLIPILAVTIGRGLLILYEWLARQRNEQIAGLISGSLVVLIILISWQRVGGYYNVNHWEYVEAGQAVDRLTPPDAKVIAPAFGDTQFLFQTNRTGWPIGFEIDDKISQGATHYVTTSDDDELRELQNRFVTLEKGARYTILDLRQPLLTGK